MRVTHNRPCEGGSPSAGNPPPRGRGAGRPKQIVTREAFREPPAMNLNSPTVPGATEPSGRVQRATKRAKLDDGAAYAGASGQDDVSVSLPRSPFSPSNLQNKHSGPQYLEVQTSAEPLQVSRKRARVTRKGGMCGRGFQWTFVEDDNTEQSSGSGLSPAANPGNNVPHAQSPVFRLLWPEIGTLRTETQLRQRLVSAGFVEEGARLFNYNALLPHGLTGEEAHLLARRISLNVDLDMNDIMGRCVPSPLPIALTRVVLSGSTGPCTTAFFTHRFQGSTLQEKRNSSLCRSYVAMLSIVRCQIVVTCVTSPCIQQKRSSTTTERLCTCGDISLYAAGLRRQLRCTQGVHFRHHRQ